jgi:hypothetical protein
LTTPAVLVLRHHALWVGHKVWAVVAAVKLHALHKEQVVLCCLALLHGHHTLAANLGHGVSNQLANLGVATCVAQPGDVVQ